MTLTTGKLSPGGANNQYREVTVPFLKNPGMTLHWFTRIRWPTISVPDDHRAAHVAIALCSDDLFVVLASRQLSGQELLEMRSTRILNGERGPQVRGRSMNGLAHQQRAGYAARKSSCQRSAQPYGYADSLLCAQDTKTGLTTACSLIISWPRCWKIRKSGSHGVVMMIRLPDFDLLRDSWGHPAEEQSLR
jgi:RNase E specificity factor CsrD